MPIVTGLAVLTAGLVLTLAGPGGVTAQNQKVTEAELEWLAGTDVRVRPGGESDWPKAIKFGVETYRDNVTKAVIAISDGGSIAVAPAGALAAARGLKWLTAHDLNARKAGEVEFTSKTRKYGVELWRDLALNRLLYTAETKSLAFAPIPPGLVTDKGPVWHHGLEPKVRALDQTTFENARKLGLEVFKDENTGGLIYITETGSIAAAPAPASPPDKTKVLPPKPEYGLVLRVRGADEKEFSDKTKKIGLEVFSDPNAGNQLLYLTETGSVAVAPKPANYLDGRGVTWLSGRGLRVRKPGEKEFDDKTTKYGLEVFQDNRTGHLIFITETGSIAVLPKP